jgi:hypothetical protein
MTRLSALGLLLSLMSSSAWAGTLHEDFSSATSPCDAQWFDDCVSGWAGIGGVDTLARTHVVNAPGRVGVLIQGGSQQTPNGISRTFAIPSGATASALQRIQVTSTGQGGDLRARLTYRDAQGVELATASGFWSLLSGTTLSFSQRDVIPAGAASVDVQFLVRGASARVFVEDWTWDGTISGTSGTPAAQAECNAQAAEVDAKEQTRCETDGGTWLGSACNGFAHPTEAGCVFVCADMCSKSGNSVVVPSGF